MKIPSLAALALLGGWLSFVPASPAATPVVFTVDPTNSVMVQSGSIVFSGLTFPFVEQSPGSLTTHYSGTVLLSLTPPAIRFSSGSLVVALTNGVWQPAAGGAAGNAPADSGGKVNINLLFLGSGTGLAAGRNIKLDITSPTLTLANSTFDTTQLAITYLTNIPPAPTMDYRVTGTGLVTSTNGSSGLAGTSTNGQSIDYLTNSAGLLKLIIPVNVTNYSQFANPNDTTMILKGQLVATAPLSAWPLVSTASVSGGQLTLKWVSVAGSTFTVWSSSDLKNWSLATGNTVMNGNLTTWTTSPAGNVRFYKVQLQ